MVKNIKLEEIVELKNLVTCQPGQVVSKTLVQNDHVSITLFAFDTDEEIAAHTSDGDAIVTILEGKSVITIGEVNYEVSAGETIVMPAGIPHALKAPEPFKMELIVIF